MPDHTGQRRDDPGLLFYNARYYDPAIGRFISADTVVPGNASGGMDGVALRPLTVAFHEPGFIATLNSEGANADKLHWGGPTNPQSLNRYAYVNNNPMRWTDPTGHWTFSLGFTISGGGLLGGTYSMGFIWDGYGVGMFTSDSVGVTAGFSGGVGANITITNADKMEDTGGAGIFVGFNGPFRVGSGDVVMGLG